MGKQRLGQFGENLAARYLESKGYRIIDRNIHFREGEIDIVARDAQEIVFVEVKCRASTLFGTPEESMHYRKVRRLHVAVFRYLALHHQRIPWRIDLVAIELDRLGKTARIRHLHNI